MRLINLVNSHEDAKLFFVHKVLGISCLASFAYRFSNVGDQDMNFSKSPLTMATILLHTSLSVSSLIFEIPIRRIKHGARIWPEYRWHSIFFALRSLAGMLVLYLFGGWPISIFKECLYTGIVLATSACADYVTKRAGEHSSATIRDLDANAATKFFYSLMQFQATAIVLYGLRRYSMNFTITWVVQFTAFLLTLQRKNLLPQFAVLVVYAIMLIITVCVGIFEGCRDGFYLMLVAGALASCLRMGLGVNKYFLWITIAILVHYLRPVAVRYEVLLAPLLLLYLILAWIAYRKINSSSSDHCRGHERTTHSGSSNVATVGTLLSGDRAIKWLAKMNVLSQEAVNDDRYHYSGLPLSDTIGGEMLPIVSSKSATATTFTHNEVQQHDKHGDLWIIINDRVYDCTEFLELHPGGAEIIAMKGGMDSTEEFVSIHSADATKMLEKYCIGNLDKSSIDSSKESDDLVYQEGNKLALNPRKKVSLRLSEKVVISRDALLLNFELPTSEHVLGLPTGQHVILSANIGGDLILRYYTPISSNHDRGCVKFVIKVYRPCKRFPEGGKMSQFVGSLEVGDYMDFKGPVGDFKYIKSGNFILGANRQCHARCYNMIAGGTGITPCMQITAEILRDTDDPTLISLVFACRVEEDLLMRSTLDTWAAEYPERFKVHYVLSDAWPNDWDYSTGFVNFSLLKNHLYAPGDGVYNLICGPPAMINKACLPSLESLGHAQDKVFVF